MNSLLKRGETHRAEPRVRNVILIKTFGTQTHTLSGAADWDAAHDCRCEGRRVDKTRWRTGMERVEEVMTLQVPACDWMALF